MKFFSRAKRAPAVDAGASLGPSQFQMVQWFATRGWENSKVRVHAGTGDVGVIVEGLFSLNSHLPMDMWVMCTYAGNAFVMIQAYCHIGRAALGGKMTSNQCEHAMSEASRNFRSALTKSELARAGVSAADFERWLTFDTDAREQQLHSDALYGAHLLRERGEDVGKRNELVTPERIGRLGLARER